MNNREFMTDSNFINACDNAGIPVTKRQASKFRQGKGLAYKLKNKEVQYVSISDYFFSSGFICVAVVVSFSFNVYRICH